jgi:hypothetical protein
MNNSCYSIATGNDSMNNGFSKSQFISQLEGIVEGLDENIMTNEGVKKILTDARCAYRKIVEAVLEHKNNIDAARALVSTNFIRSLSSKVEELKAAADSLVEKPTYADPSVNTENTGMEKHTAAADGPPAKAAGNSVEKELKAAADSLVEKPTYADPSVKHTANADASHTNTDVQAYPAKQEQQRKLRGKRRNKDSGGLQRRKKDGSAVEADIRTHADVEQGDAASDAGDCSLAKQKQERNLGGKKRRNEASAVDNNASDAGDCSLATQKQERNLGGKKKRNKASAAINNLYNLVMNASSKDEMTYFLSFP